jgi:prevent-host-death family protein
MNIRVISSTEAQNQFGKLLEDAQKEPVMIQKNGRDQVVIISASEYEEIKAKQAANPLVQAAHKRSIERRRSVYEALAK